MKLFKRFGSKGKIIGGILVALLLTASLGVGVSLVRRPQNIGAQASGGVVLSFLTSSVSPKVGDTFVVAVVMDTKGLKAAAADIRVEYDSSKLEAQSIKAGDFLPIILKPGVIKLSEVTKLPDQQNSSLRIVLGSQPTSSKTGSGVLAEVVFRAKASGVSSITFGDDSEVAAIGQFFNVVGTKNSAQITIGEASPIQIKECASNGQYCASDQKCCDPAATCRGNVCEVGPD